MEAEFLEYYERELKFIREMSGEFARAYPKIARRLAMDEFECSDPYVERLLEGFSFLAARIQYKIDAEFPRFTQHLLNRIYPHYLSPTPSMGVVQLQPDLSDPALADGQSVVPRHTQLKSRLSGAQQTPCIYRTGHGLTLWPLEVVRADYLPTRAALESIGITASHGAKAGVRIRLRCTAELPFCKLPLDRLPVYLRGGDATAVTLYEAMVGRSLGVLSRGSGDWSRVSYETPAQLGFSAAESLLPYGPESFQGYRLIQEYFAFPERFLFVELQGLALAVSACDTSELDICVLLDSQFSALDGAIDAQRLLLYCTPVVNIFPKRADRIHLTDGMAEYHVLPDRTRPLDFEVFQVTGVVGYGDNTEHKQEFRSFYSMSEASEGPAERAYFACHREKRLLSERQRRNLPRNTYLGSEVFVSLVDADEAPYSPDLRQLSLSLLCTNRDLPFLLSQGALNTVFSLDLGLPLEREHARCVEGPTSPKPSFAHGETAWRLVNHLSLNYLSMAGDNHWRFSSDGQPDADSSRTAVEALRDMLSLYADIAEPVVEKHINGVVGIQSRAVVRRMPGSGPVIFGRGLEVTLRLDEEAFEGFGVFLLGAVLEQFFRKYTAINSFTETVIETIQRGEIMRWPPRIGQRQIF